MKKLLLFSIAILLGLWVHAQQPQWEQIGSTYLDLAQPTLKQTDVLSLRFAIRDEMGNSIAFALDHVAVYWEGAEADGVQVMSIPVHVESNMAELHLAMADLAQSFAAKTGAPLVSGSKFSLQLQDFTCPALGDNGTALSSQPGATFAFQVD